MPQRLRFVALEQRGADQTQALPETFLEAAALFVKCHEQVADERSQNLDQHRVFAAPEEFFDAQMLLDPFEEQFDRPTVFVALRDIKCAAGMSLVANTMGVLLSGRTTLTQRSGFL